MLPVFSFFFWRQKNKKHNTTQIQSKSPKPTRTDEECWDAWDWELELGLIVELNKIDQKLDKVKKIEMQLCYKIKSLIRFCASIILFFKIINMRGYLWIFNWWWPYSPNPSCPLALKNDLKILICSFCFVSSFHFARVSRTLWFYYW